MNSKLDQLIAVASKHHIKIIVDPGCTVRYVKDGQQYPNASLLTHIQTMEQRLVVHPSFANNAWVLAHELGHAFSFRLRPKLHARFHNPREYWPEGHDPFFVRIAEGIADTFAIRYTGQTRLEGVGDTCFGYDAVKPNTLPSHYVMKVVDQIMESFL